MREGQNPAKRDVPAYRPERLGVVTLVYIPFQNGYYAQSWQVFLRHIASLRQYTPEPYNYTVFDNGSCPEVRRELAALQEAGWIDWLTLSAHNLGKTGALNAVLPGLPNEWVCYVDSDMLFRPGWLEESWKIEQAFPNCGMIGAQIIFPDWEVDRGNTAFRQSGDPRFVFDTVQPEGWMVEEYCRGRGISAQRREFYAAMQLDRVTERESGVQAILGGNSHQQYLARKEVLQNILPLPAGLQLSRQEDTHQDRELDRLGYLHLTTTRPYLYHMGNTLDEELGPELARLALPGGAAGAPPVSARRTKNHPVYRALERLSRSKTGRKWLVRLYDNLYDILS